MPLGMMDDIYDWLVGEKLEHFAHMAQARYDSHIESVSSIAHDVVLDANQLIKQLQLCIIDDF